MVEQEKELELFSCESICSEITVNKVKWIALSLYRSPSPSNLQIFFEELTSFLNKAIYKYDNVLIMGDLNIDILNTESCGHKKLHEICDTYSLSNLIKEKTCFASKKGTLIDIILTNRP